ncbi:MAG TPA: hypothetical protein PLJ33_05805 [Peptococcaceae bacterium]|jgi:hypothetical protein|nr:hypothetical protein [Peptococcaceae bacterium]HPZ71380.1 hypothetical protein [Peptococcaceae bacterium]HQD54359.1 hypothetical protein [Peptococcaceae bacterium]
MKQRRVGTLSMGLLLIIAGAMLVYAQINAQNALELVLTWWPIILFMLGLEVLWAYYSAKDEKPKIKYDLLSIFIILFIIFTAVGIYTLNQVGVASYFTKMIATEHYTVPLPTQELAVDDSIKKIVVDSSGLELNLRTGMANIIAAHGDAYVAADSRQTAEEMLPSSVIVDRKIGDTLYLSFNYRGLGNDRYYHSGIDDLTLILPADRQIEVESHNYLEVNADNPAKRLSIKGDGVVELNIPAAANCQIKAYVEHPSYLSGNVEWQLDGKNEQDRTDKENRENWQESPKDMGNPDIGKPAEDVHKGEREKEYRQALLGKVTFGAGEAPITVIGRNEVRVNQI